MQGSAVAFGLGAVVVGSQPVFIGLRWLGVVYLCHLGVHALRGAWRGDYPDLETTIHSDRGGRTRAYREGLVTNITNPKVMALYLSVLPQFLHPGASSTPDALLLAYTVATLGSAWLLVLVFFIHKVRAWLHQRRVRRSIDATTGTALFGFGLALAVE